MLLLASLTGAYADNGSLSIQNIRNVVPGYSGSFDIVLTGSDVMYVGYEFSLTLPTGLTYTGYSNGSMINGHQATISGTTTKLFTGVANPTANFTAMNGPLLTIYFSVDDNATGTLTGGLLSGIVMSTAGAAEINLSNQEFSAPVVDNMVTLDENYALSSNVIDGVQVTVNRTIAADKWNTICLPFAMTSEQVTEAFGADVLIGDFTGYDMDDQDNIKVNFDQVYAIEANHPYIIKVSSDITSFSVTGTVAINPSNKPMKNVGTNSASRIKAIIGTYEPIILEEDWLYLKDNQFKYSTGISKLKPFRAYFRFWEFYSSSGARMTINFEEKTTGIKAIDNGQLIIDNVQCSMFNGQWSIFNLQGQRVARPAKGVYIREGKKYIIK